MNPDECVIQFNQFDFETAFFRAGITLESLTQAEWDSFTDSFLDGTGWSEVASYAAENIADDRENEETT